MMLHESPLHEAPQTTAPSTTRGTSEGGEISETDKAEVRGAASVIGWLIGVAFWGGLGFAVGRYTAK